MFAPGSSRARGRLAGRFVTNRGGYGLKGDSVLGLVGSIVGSAISRGLGSVPDVGVIGAAGVTALPRAMWATVA
jgi:uncharacterized membrane protein YeaQ/YmgE (transglycosylase-associated protein family)